MEYDYLHVIKDSTVAQIECLSLSYDIQSKQGKQNEKEAFSMSYVGIKALPYLSHT